VGFEGAIQVLRPAVGVGAHTMRKGTRPMPDSGPDAVVAASSWHRLERREVVTSRSFDEVLADLERRTAHPDLSELRSPLATAGDAAAVDEAITDAMRGRGLMLLSRLDLDLVLHGAGRPRLARLVLGDPRLLRGVAKHLPEVAAAVPTTVLVFEGPDGVHLAFDTASSAIPVHLDGRLDEAATEIDELVLRLIAEVAGPGR
jgi:uncharacterized protein (DUF302 family)